MSQRKVVKKKNGGCCWRKLLGKAFKKRHCEDISSNIGQNDEIIYLSLYLTSLEKKMQAIEEVTKLKWYSKEIDRKSRAEGHYVRNNINHNHSDAIIQEIMSLGNNHFENRKWASLTAPSVITDQRSMIGIITEMQSSIQNVEYIAIKYHVAAICHPVEIHAVCYLGEVTYHNPRTLVKASCSISYFNTENKTIEITYDNREWDKRGVIVLKDIENQTGVQAELMGRIVCFLLGMGEVDLV